MTIAVLLLVIALVLFVVSAVGVPSSRFNLQSLGLALMVLAALIGGARVM